MSSAGAAAALSQKAEQRFMPVVATWSLERLRNKRGADVRRGRATAAAGFVRSVFIVPVAYSSFCWRYRHFYEGREAECPPY